MNIKYFIPLLALILGFNSSYGVNRTIEKKGSVNLTSKETTERSGTIKLKSAESTFLYVTKATQMIGDLNKQGGDYFEWRGNGEIDWTINTISAEECDMYMTVDIPEESNNSEMVFTSGSHLYKFTLNTTSGPYGKNDKNMQRIKVLSELQLIKGDQVVGLKSTGSASGKRLINIRSIELVPLSARKSIEKENNKAKASRASTKWLTKAGYGVMFHWTSQSVNPDGSNKPYEQAVNDFDVQKFTSMVEETGAGYVIFTIGHAEPYCPAPIKSWEKFHPGKTTKRDLIAEISDQLKTKNIRLICYMATHIVAKYQKVNSTEFTKINTEILQEMGERYKDKIAGYWFDGWYQCFEEYPDVSFESFFKATKTGNNDRIIALNSWIYPTVTPWQEYLAGEVARPIDAPENGFMKGGPAPDLPYHALLTMEPYWVQEKAEIPTPQLNSSELSQYIKNCMTNGGAVTINMGIYQNGHVGDKALQVMKEVRNQIRFK